MNLGLSILSLARFQFAMTTVFHFFFVPLSIGLALVVAIMETVYVVKKDIMYKHMAQGAAFSYLALPLVSWQGLYKNSNLGWTGLIIHGLWVTFLGRH